MPIKVTDRLDHGTWLEIKHKKDKKAFPKS